MRSNRCAQKNVDALGQVLDSNVTELHEKPDIPPSRRWWNNFVIL